jgi:hypothetical protein
MRCVECLRAKWAIHIWNRNLRLTEMGILSYLRVYELCFNQTNRLYCRNDIGHELIDDNNMIYLPLYIVTRNMYSTSRKLIS